MGFKVMYKDGQEIDFKEVERLEHLGTLSYLLKDAAGSSKAVIPMNEVRFIRPYKDEVKLPVPPPRKLQAAPEPDRMESPEPEE